MSCVPLRLENERFAETEDGIVHEVWDHHLTFASFACGVQARRPIQVDIGFPDEKKVRRFLEQGTVTCLGCVAVSP